MSTPSTSGPAAGSVVGYSSSLSARASPTQQKSSPSYPNTSPAHPLTTRQQKEQNLRQNVIATQPPTRSPQTSSTPAVMRTMTARNHETGELRSQEKTKETEEAFLTVPTRAHPEQQPLLTSTTATFSIVDTIPIGATIARREMETKLITAKKNLENDKTKPFNALNGISSSEFGLNSPVPVGSLADIVAATTITNPPSSTSETPNLTNALVTALSTASSHLTPTNDIQSQELSALRAKDGLDIIDFEFILQKLLSLVAGQPIHDLFHSVLTGFFTRIFKHFLTIDAVKQECQTVAQQKQLLYDSTLEIERELRLLKKKNNEMELTISIQEGMISRRTTELTAAREKYYANLLLIREIVQQHGIHPDLLVSYMPGDIANSDAKHANAEKQRANLLENYQKIHTLLDHRCNVLLNAMKATIFGLMQQFQKKLDRCNSKIRTIDVYLSKARYKMRKQIHVYDLLIKGELTADKIREIQDKHAKDEEIAAIEQEARRAAAAAEEAARRGPSEPHRSAREQGAWRELEETHPQGFQLLSQLAERHRIQWERMERQARDGDLELMDEEDLQDHIETVLKDGAPVPAGTKSTPRARAESGASAGGEEKVEDDEHGSRSTTPRPPSSLGGSKKSKQLPPSSSRPTGTGRRTSRMGRKASFDANSSSASSRRTTSALSPSSSTGSLLSDDKHRGSVSLGHRKSVMGGKRGSEITTPRGTNKSSAAFIIPDARERTPRDSSLPSDDEPLTDRDRQIQNSWTEVESEAIDRERRRKEQKELRRKQSSRYGSSTGHSRDDSSSDGTRTNSTGVTSGATSESRTPAALDGGATGSSNSPSHRRGESEQRDTYSSRPTSSLGPNEKGETGSLLRPNTRDHQRSASSSVSRRDSDSSSSVPPNERESYLNAPSRSETESSTPRSGRSARETTKQNVRAELNQINDELAASSTAYSILEKRNKEILEKIRALDQERKLINSGPVSNLTSGLTSLSSTRRGSMTGGLDKPFPSMVSPTNREREEESGSNSPTKRPPTAKDEDGGTQEPSELPTDRATEEAILKAKEDRQTRIAYSSQLERQRKELERERRRVEKENLKLASKLRQLETKKQDVIDSLENEGKLADGSTPTQTRPPSALASDVKEHENIFHKVIMRSVGLQVGMPFTLMQHQPQTAQPTQFEAKEPDEASLTGSNYPASASSAYPHPLMLQMQTLGVHPQQMQAYLQQQFALQSHRSPPSIMLSPDHPNFEAFQAAYGDLGLRSYPEGGQDPAEAIYARSIGTPFTPTGSLSTRQTHREPNTLNEISNSLTLSASQRDLLFKAELRRRRELEKSMSVFARLQSRGATSEEATRHLRGLMQQERTKEIERVLKDLDLLKSQMTPQSSTQNLIHDPSQGHRSSSNSPTRSTSMTVHYPAPPRSRGGGFVTNSSNNSSRPSTATGYYAKQPESILTGEPPRNNRPLVSRSNPSSTTSTPYPHVIPSSSSNTTTSSPTGSPALTPSSLLIRPSSSQNDRRSQLLSNVMSQSARMTQQQQAPGRR